MRILALTRRARALAAVTAALALPASLFGQARPRADSTTAGDSTAQRLERVMISAVRATGVAPISEKTLARATIESRYFGQDVPLVLQGAAPGLTAYAETANYWGYSYIRLRGLDQSRINLTLDGIPLNDPEDQVLYFADFPDLANSLQSVQIQRGVGTSSNGTAAFAGSINMETISLATRSRGGEVQVEGGSFGSKRVSAEYESGLLPSRFAVYGRVSGLRTTGYRYHSGVEGTSAFFSGGYFGDRDIVKLTATTGVMHDTMAYLAVSSADLAGDRRINPLTPRERDGFGERLAAVSYTRLLGPRSSVTTTAYRLSASGDYDVLIDSLWDFHLDFVSYGAASAWSFRRDGLQLDVGVNASTYARDHYAYIRPQLATPLYFNTGHKQDASGFAKIGYGLGQATVFADVQVRHARFGYTPDQAAGVAETSIDWTFLNPKAGVSYQLSSSWSASASFGMNSREPARNDMLAGLDNLDTSNVNFVGPLKRVRPEKVRDLEIGTVYHTGSLNVQANVYAMSFRDEIAPIGALSYIGTPLRKNVASSYRRGLEADATYRAHPRLELGATLAVSENRIRQYVDSTDTVPKTYNNVEPLLTPRLLSSGRARFVATHYLELGAEGRYQSRSFLQNTSNAAFVLPASFNLDGSVALLRDGGRQKLSIRSGNLTDSKKFASGYASGGTSYYYVVPPRNLFVTVTVSF